MKFHWSLIVFAALLMFMLSDQKQDAASPLANAGTEQLAWLHSPEQEWLDSRP